MQEFLGSLSINVLVGIVGAIFSMIVTMTAKSFFDKLRTVKFKVGDTEITLRPDNLDKTVKEIEEKIIDLQKHPRVFISYSHNDRDFAIKLAKDLREEGIDIWIDFEQLKAGDSLAEKIHEAINSSQWIVMIPSTNTTKTNYLNKELDFALRAEKERGRALIIPVIYKTIELPVELSDKVFVDFEKNYEDGLKFLLSSIKRVSQNV